ncbi:hypothetical protein DH86_00004058 [Scytalidium sp. 3C]|nr:hypothetical protein DH86_00004058 [Scytalidium sp. 3C]
MDLEYPWSQGVIFGMLKLYGEALSVLIWDSYVGTLHEINSETSTVALENVTSFGTEGRKANPDDEIPPSDSVYEYIVFRGSDVKDLRIEEAPAPKEAKPPQVPNDPAILGSGARPQQAPIQNQQQPGAPQAGPPSGSQQPGQPGQGAPPFGQYPPQYFPPPPGGWGRAGPPPGYPGMPYGAPPGWYPPPGQGFPPAHFPPYGYPPGPPGPPGPQFAQGAGPKPTPIGQGANKQQAPPSAPGVPTEKQDDKGSSKVSADGTAPQSTETQSAPGKPGSAAQAPLAQPAVPQNISTSTATRAVPAGPKSAARVQPAVPLPSSAAALKSQPPATSNASSASATVTSGSLKDATEAATAAVAAAMAKLPPANGQSNGNAIDNLTQKVNEMRTNDTSRAPRQPGSGGFADRGRGRGRGRGEVRKVEVPATDFDFESANAKFNKDDLVKEAIAGGQEDTAPAETEGDSAKPALPASGYNKSTSFFDNISSEAKERAEGGGTRPGGREWRGEEQRKNLETFGQGSVDTGFRGGFRGRGRGRGHRGRGYGGQGGRGRGGYRGGRGDAQAAVQ